MRFKKIGWASLRESQGFTLLELIVVITIIGLLSTLVVVSTKNIGPNARRTKIISDLETIQKVAMGIFTETGQWPESIEAMVDAKDSSGKGLMNALDKFPKDPWGHEYKLEIVDGQAKVTCLGVDNAEGGDNEAEDMVRPEERNK